MENSRGVCLAGETKILTQEGEIEIKKIVEEELDIAVLTYNEITFDLEWKKINEFIYSGEKEIVEIEFENGKILRCTEDHKIYTKNNGWKKAITLNEEDDVFFFQEQ